MSKSKFRLLILIYVAFTMATIAAGFISSAYSPGLTLAYNDEPRPFFAVNWWISFAVLGGLLLLVVFGTIGLYFLKPWARTLSVFTTLTTAILMLFFGPTLQTAIESSLDYISVLLWGAILAISYCSPINSFFIKPSRDGL